MRAACVRRAIGRPDERGAGSVLVLGVAGAIVALTALVVPLLAVHVAGQRAANAADAAALAAADALSGAVPGIPCDLAAATAARNGAAMADCRTDGPVASVVVEVRGAGLTASARARAGPPGWAG
ncbi:Rv3654c family TadE-like protein [Agromyces sp. MMS24-K17]|uniref:Rv3654c family TadE-like protein n=1 Tax=Agromyces sp. MMS24-K17 TaxID=3372850 RepID=UPI0037544B4B